MEATNMPVHQDTAASHPMPAMDVMPPRSGGVALKTPPPSSTLASEPLSKDASSTPSAHAATSHTTRTMLQPTRTRGVAVAILATIIITLGLGILMMYAYLRSSGISVF